MGQPKWNDGLSVHIDKMDKQHRLFIEMMGDLWSAVNSGADTDKLNELVKQTTVLIANHCRDEEALMAENCFPGLRNHQVRHQEMIHSLRARYLIPISKGKKVLTTTVLEELVRTALDHFKTEDKKYGQYIRSRRHVVVR